ncbi:hypothetical protein [Rhizobium leguminosarum]|uniref:hypothetical protein n=1 Tax=Rhizobium leguminosarum TaxID=384 RepID=UPI001F3CABAD|nr:hypothetical protein [Rhizobium leguminosarum]
MKILRDRTEQRQIEIALRERTRALEILNRAGANLARENDLEKVMTQIIFLPVSSTR